MVLRKIFVVIVEQQDECEPLMVDGSVGVPWFDMARASLKDWFVPIKVSQESNSRYASTLRHGNPVDTQVDFNVEEPHPSTDRSVVPKTCRHQAQRTSYRWQLAVVASDQTGRYLLRLAVLQKFSPLWTLNLITVNPLRMRNHDQ